MSLRLVVLADAILGEGIFSGASSSTGGISSTSSSSSSSERTGAFSFSGRGVGGSSLAGARATEEGLFNSASSLSWASRSSSANPAYACMALKNAKSESRNKMCLNVILGLESSEILLFFLVLQRKKGEQY